ncbi:MAG: sigma factor [Polyangiaceae bacterium]
MDRETQAVVAKAREELLGLVATVRPELHRYASRLTGSVIEGEDIVQEALARAFYTLPLTVEVPPLRPWLFKITHNAALDHLKRHGHKLTEPRADLADVVGAEEGPDPYAVRAALAHFLGLPLVQRSAVILKDVLGHSLEEAAETMGTSVLAVKAALVRGRAGLREATPIERPRGLDHEADLERYAAALNARDWDGVRALVADDCRLDLVSKAARRGKEVGQYFGRYEKEPVSLGVVRLDGRLVLAAYVGAAEVPSYFILLAWEEGRVVDIRDFRYVPYVAAEAELDSVGR